MRNYFQETIKARQFEQKHNYKRAIAHWRLARELTKWSKDKEYCQDQINNLMSTLDSVEDIA